MRDYCVEILTRQGRDWTRCELCGAATGKKPCLHHMRYKDATIHDLRIVCYSCNLVAENRGLA